MTRWVMHLSLKCGDLSLDPRTHKPGCSSACKNNCIQHHKQTNVEGPRLKEKHSIFISQGGGRNVENFLINPTGSKKGEKRKQRKFRGYKELGRWK